ncbi:hypothetical protein PGT21_019635 [Puccinia graminis f. sp. tritici]|uniref:Secreted protein n=1 Tax=Puccinia graminis f. sp. tritici TaxID=56615 RepID=A0A5B0Q5Z3_PUCGR|nr:hypothetical protein PGT21_019635 [Puccinia graminis f. sp. tritici]
MFLAIEVLTLFPIASSSSASTSLPVVVQTGRFQVFQLHKVAIRRGVISFETTLRRSSLSLIAGYTDWASIGRMAGRCFSRILQAFTNLAGLHKPDVLRSSKGTSHGEESSAVDATEVRHQEIREIAVISVPQPLKKSYCVMSCVKSTHDNLDTFANCNSSTAWNLHKEQTCRRR